MPIDVPLICKKNIESKFHCFFNMKSLASKRILLLNWGLISSLKFVRKYPKALRPYFYRMLVHKLVTSNATIAVLLS